MRLAIALFAAALATSAPLAAAQPVPVPAFRSVELNGGGSIVIRPGAAQRVTILAGSTQFTRFRVGRDGKLRIDACNNRCPRRYDLRIEIQSPNVPPLGIHGGGSITAAPGFAVQRTLAAGVDGGGIIDLRAVRSGSVAAGINGGGIIKVGPSRSLAAGVNGGGEVRYAGNPAVTTAINGGGTVRPGS